MQARLGDALKHGAGPGRPAVLGHGFLVDLIEFEPIHLLAGEARFRHLYTRAGAADEVAARWAEALGERAIVRTQAGIEDWFGPIAAGVRPRIGDVVVAALGDFAVFSSKEFGIELKMTGFHGSITEAELRIPVLIAR